MVSARRVDERANNIASRQREIDQLRGVGDDVDALAQQTQRMRAQLAFLQTIHRRAGAPNQVRLLDEIAAAVPPRAWVTSVWEHGGFVTLTGHAMDNSDISAFLRALQKSPQLSDIHLRYGQHDFDDAVTVFPFEIGCTVKYAE